VPLELVTIVAVGVEHTKTHTSKKTFVRIERKTCLAKIRVIKDSISLTVRLSKIFWLGLLKRTSHAAWL